MSVVSPLPKYAFGVRGDVANNVWYLDEQNIIYPAGANLIIYNIDQRLQKFIPCSKNGKGMTALAVSPNKRYVAFAEKHNEKPTIAVVDLTTLNRKKTIVLQETNSQEIISIAFSPDSKYLISQVTGPDWTLAYWHWEKAKAMATVKSNGATNHQIRQVRSI